MVEHWASLPSIPQSSVAQHRGCAEGVVGAGLKSRLTRVVSTPEHTQQTPRRANGLLQW